MSAGLSGRMFGKVCRVIVVAGLVAAAVLAAYLMMWSYIVQCNLDVLAAQFADNAGLMARQVAADTALLLVITGIVIFDVACHIAYFVWRKVKEIEAGARKGG